MKLLIPPPNLDAPHLVSTDGSWLDAWSLVYEIGANYRGHRAIAREVQKDLLRFASKHKIAVLPNTHPLTSTVHFLFPRHLAEGWLDTGGRAWIVAELEARSSRRVVPFRGGAA